ncbi:MAG: dTDP-4-dehydrorhamnose reductase [candidate division Zixibacteria bacterium]|nr:dTDP-4-dehydrorhamnose reductase [candidate division Zixibacteria bacterium]
MKILITGSRGQLGSDLVKYFTTDFEVLGVDIKEMDVTDPAEVSETFDSFRPDIVLHAAAYTDVDGAEADTEPVMKVNAEGTAHIAQSCKEHGARMVYYSTDYVFDGRKGAPYMESDVPFPINEYGRSKLEGEKRVAEILDNFTVLRTAWLYGAYGKNFVRAVIRRGWQQIRAKHDGQIVTSVKVVNDQAGNPTWTMEVARQTRVVIENNLRGIIHATAEGETTWYDFAKEIFEYLKMPVYISPCSSEEYGSAAVRPANSSLENVVLKKAGLNVMRDYKAALFEFLSQTGELTE